MVVHSRCEKVFRALSLKNPLEEFSEAIGFASILTVNASVESFKSIFELLWNERILNEELKKAEKMQKEFINIASHEIRKPIQPILVYAETYWRGNEREQYRDIHRGEEQKCKETLEVNKRYIRCC